MSQTRRLAAILAADVAGYSRLIGADEGGTLKALRAALREKGTVARKCQNLHENAKSWRIIPRSPVKLRF